jgi:hypothetical protein
MSNQVPEDSVLRRHYEQLQRSPKPTASAKPPKVEAAAPEPAPAAPPPRPAPASPPPSSSDGGGILGWLKRLFG